MASWRPQDSNLEPLGSILEGFGLDFGAFGMLQNRFLKALDLLLACCLQDFLMQFRFFIEMPRFGILEQMLNHLNS